MINLRKELRLGMLIDARGIRAHSSSYVLPNSNTNGGEGGGSPVIANGNWTKRPRKRGREVYTVL